VWPLACVLSIPMDSLTAKLAFYIACWLRSAAF
jgi:hypothetical protein